MASNKDIEIKINSRLSEGFDLFLDYKRCWWVFPLRKWRKYKALKRWEAGL